MSEPNPLYDAAFKSNFDQSFITLGRIGKYLEVCNVAARSNDLMEWFTALEVVFREFSSYITNEELAKEEQTHQSIMRTIGLFLQTPAVQRKDGRLYNKNFFDTKQVLHEWEIHQRRELQRLGLLMKEAEPALMGMFK